MFGFPKTAIGEPIEFGKAKVNNQPTEVPYVVMKTMKNDKLLKSVFLEKGKGFNAGFTYMKMFKTIQLIFQKGKNKISFTFPFNTSASSLAGMVKTKTIVLEHHELGADARLTLDLTTFLPDLKDKWRNQVTPDFLLAKFKADGTPMEKFNLVKNQFIEKMEAEWVVETE